MWKVSTNLSQRKSKSFSQVKMKKKYPASLQKPTVQIMNWSLIRRKCVQSLSWEITRNSPIFTDRTTIQPIPENLWISRLSITLTKTLLNQKHQGPSTTFFSKKSLNGIKNNLERLKRLKNNRNRWTKKKKRKAKQWWSFNPKRKRSQIKKTKQQIST